MGDDLELIQVVICVAAWHTWLGVVTALGHYFNSTARQLHKPHLSAIRDLYLRSGPVLCGLQLHRTLSLRSLSEDDYMQPYATASLQEVAEIVTAGSDTYPEMLNSEGT